ncbi:M56 family metallopeptidase [Phenylobacterium sp.]|uniref:M56 family metallopeptidase n=1 Tax=Phenylobacterium sp. TaxID=1871053 RepID=UPI002ED96A1B
MASSSLQAVLGPDPGAVIASAFLLANVVGAAAVAVVALARLPARRLAGPSAAYNLWLLPPLAGFLSPVLVLIQHANAPITAPPLGLPLTVLATVWALGALGVGAAFTLAQARFMADVRAGIAGPAVVGLIYPRILLPAENAGYTAEERELIRAHEREHVARKDPRAAALAALLQALCWFNPLVHLAAFLLRLDQELACDAAVIRGRPDARTLYGETLLKTQLAATPLPFGCYWPARGLHPLEVRIGLLKRRKGVAVRSDGTAVVSATVESIRP